MLHPLAIATLLAPIPIAGIVFRVITRVLLPRVDRRDADRRLTVTAEVAATAARQEAGTASANGRQAA